MANKRERGAASQGNFHDDPNAPAGANPKPEAAGTGTKSQKRRTAAQSGAAKGEKLYVVKDNVSGKLHSHPLPKAKAEDKLKLVEEKERREHSKEAQFDFVIIEHTSDEE